MPHSMTCKGIADASKCWAALTLSEEFLCKSQSTIHPLYLLSCGRKAGCNAKGTSAFDPKEMPLTRVAPRKRSQKMMSSYPRPSGETLSSKGPP
eukprot:4587573-Amphidinium_carterae.1